MQAEELTAEFGIAGVLDFVETEHGLVKASISLDGMTGELYRRCEHQISMAISTAAAQ